MRKRSRECSRDASSERSGKCRDDATQGADAGEDGEKAAKLLRGSEPVESELLQRIKGTYADERSGSVYTVSGDGTVQVTLAPKSFSTEPATVTWKVRVAGNGSLSCGQGTLTEAGIRPDRLVWSRRDGNGADLVWLRAGSAATANLSVGGPLGASDGKVASNGHDVSATSSSTATNGAALAGLVPMLQAPAALPGPPLPLPAAGALASPPMPLPSAPLGAPLLAGSPHVLPFGFLGALGGPLLGGAMPSVGLAGPPLPGLPCRSSAGPQGPLSVGLLGGLLTGPHGALPPGGPPGGLPGMTPGNFPGGLPGGGLLGGLPVLPGGLPAGGLPVGRLPGGLQAGPTGGFPGGVPGGLPGGFAGGMEGGLPGMLPGRLPGGMPGHMTAGPPGRLPGVLPGSLLGVQPGLGGLPGALPGGMPTRLSGGMPGLFPSPMGVMGSLQGVARPGPRAPMPALSGGMHGGVPSGMRGGLPGAPGGMSGGMPGVLPGLPGGPLHLLQGAPFLPTAMRGQVAGGMLGSQLLMPPGGRPPLGPDGGSQGRPAGTLASLYRAPPGGRPSLISGPGRPQAESTPMTAPAPEAARPAPATGSRPDDSGNARSASRQPARLAAGNAPGPAAPVEDAVEDAVPHEERQWYYKDADGAVQGPFTSSLMSAWSRQNFFPPETLVRAEDEKDFSELGNGMRLLTGSIKPAS